MATLQPITTNTAHENFDHPHAKKHALIALLGILLIIAIGAWQWVKRTRPIDPYQSLEILEEGSFPVSQTPEERLSDLRALESQSAPVKASPSERLLELEELVR